VYSRISNSISVLDSKTKVVLLEFSPDTELFRPNIPLVSCQRTMFNTYCANKMTVEIKNTLPEFDAVCVKKSETNECMKMAIIDTKGYRSNIISKFPENVENAPGPERFQHF